MKTPAELESYPVLLAQNVVWGEMDSFQHINNVTYFRYFENVRMELFRDLKICNDRGAVVGEIGPILGETSCRFKAPLTYPDRIIIAARVDEVGEDRFTIDQVIYSTALGRMAATGSALIVSYDYQALKKAQLPQAWKDNIGALKVSRAPSEID